jgi:hypothetical protein
MTGGGTMVDSVLSYMRSEVGISASCMRKRCQHEMVHTTEEIEKTVRLTRHEPQRLLK